MRAGPAVRVFAVLASIVLLAPLAIVIATSFTDTSVIVFPPRGFSIESYATVLGSPQWLSGFQNSLVVALLASVIAMTVGLLLALGSTRGPRRLSRFIAGVSILPILIPGIVLAVAIYSTFVGLGLFGNVGSLAVAHAALGVPFVFLNADAALRGMSRSAEEAAATLGATRIGVLWHITLPQVLPALLAGGLFSFLISWDELLVSMFLNTPQFRTLPVLIYGQVRAGIDPSTSAVAALLTLVSFLVFCLAQLGIRFAGRRRRKV